ncbi:lactonase family protein [Virgibacillus halophilus]|uniref:lactonase family protein n=1 Tax=Tigheibacillus halophilus TaxID=361280 RepID=UPI003642ED47
MGKNYTGYVGTYTRENSEGIYKFSLNTEAKKLENVELVAKVGNPTFIAFSEDHKHAYAVCKDGDMGGVASYEVKADSGNLRYLNRRLQRGASPCHVEVKSQHLSSGNYHEGTVTLYHINSRGSLETDYFVVQHEGHGPHERQEKSHVHFTGFTPDGKYIVVCDLGTDEIATYQAAAKNLEKVASYQVKGGSGPRHIAFHPNGKWAYVITELSSEIIVLDYDASSGSFREKQTVSTLPAAFKGKNDASAIKLSADGKYVYAANRGHNSLAVFHVDMASGELKHTQQIASGGDFPRDFSLDPSGKFVVVANQKSNHLVLFSRDEANGKLEQLSSVVNVPEGVCVQFLS